MKIEKTKQSIIDFAKQVKNGAELEREQYRRKKKEITAEVGKLKSRGSNLHLHWKEISDLEDDEFYGFCGDFEQKEDNIQTDLEKEVESNEFTILTYGENTDGWKEANANLEEQKNELIKQIELMLRFEELGENWTHGSRQILEIK